MHHQLVKIQAPEVGQVCVIRVLDISGLDEHLHGLLKGRMAFNEQIGVYFAASNAAATCGLGRALTLGWLGLNGQCPRLRFIA